MIRSIFLAFVIALDTATQPAVSIKVSPQVVRPDHMITITCFVPRRAENRWLDVVLGDYVASTRQLDGDRAPYAWQFVPFHLSCDVEAVGCRVRGQGIKDSLVAVTLLRPDCE